MHYVIGSGPAGISCASALVRKGLDVTMLDFGLELEEERMAVVEEMGKIDHRNWKMKDIEFLKENMNASSKGVPIKYAYGSDFPYRNEGDFMNIDIKEVDLLPSLAQGGFSSVWGAAVLPYLSEDISDWPITLEALVPYYESVLSFMYLSAQEDDLADLFPLYSSNYNFLDPSKQAKTFYGDLERNKQMLNSQGFCFGYSRLAVNSKQNENGFGCVYCGLCMYGCPYRLIYSSSLTLNDLKKYNNFRYINNVYVYKVAEKNGNATVLALSRTTNEKLIFEAERIFVAAGVLPTTKILLESMEEFGTELSMKDSQYFIFPLLRYKSSDGVIEESLHTLAQIYMEIFDVQISERTVHLQIYTYNDLYIKALKNILGRLYGLFKLPINSLLSRLLIVQGYLHSDLSSEIKLRLLKTEGEKTNKLIVSAAPKAGVDSSIHKILQKLSKNKKYTKAIPLKFLLKIARPGKGFHSGGTFPMSKEPKKFETDILGRPAGFKHIHAVDATVFPSIPATTITFSVMANAYRIADESTK